MKPVGWVSLFSVWLHLFSLFELEDMPTGFEVRGDGFIPFRVDAVVVSVESCSCAPVTIIATVILCVLPPDAVEWSLLLMTCLTLSLILK